MGSLLSILQKHFAQVYILTLSHRKDRQELIAKQLTSLGLPQPDTTPYIRWFYATSFPHNDIIANAFNSSRKGRFTKPAEYDCARNHYSIVKISRDTLSLTDYVLILEDDILFCKDPELLISYIENLPQDYDIAQFGGFTADSRISQYIQNATTHWVKHKHVGLWNCSAYALSRKGMEFYLTFMDKILFWVADGPLYKAPLSDTLINTYVSREPLVIQASKHIVQSDIRTLENDTIDYDNQNMYEKDINLENFFSVS